MAVKNQLAKKQFSQETNDKIVEYKVGEDMIRLTPNMVKAFLVNGNGAVTDQEVAMFINLCRYQRLNPFLREAYLIKFGNSPATIVTGKEAITKRAMRNPKYEGQQAGVVIYHEDSEELEYRSGSLLMAGEQLVGGWAKVYVKGYQVPIEAIVSYNEYVGLTKDGEVNAQWGKKPATMIRKVALVQALREAFPEDLGGMYDVAEMGVDFDETAVAPVYTEPVEEPQAPAPAANKAPANAKKDTVITEMNIPMPLEEAPNF